MGGRSWLPSKLAGDGKMENFYLRRVGEDSMLTGQEITRRALENSMQEVIKCLNFTTEVGEGEERWLATLDTSLRVEPNNKISYTYYEKPTTTNVLVQRRSALEENSKNQILSNDLVRRLGNVDDQQNKEMIKTVVDSYSQKLLTSGYSRVQTRRIILNGIRGWENKKSRAKREQRRVNRTAKESMKGRVIKKAIGKNNWFRKSTKSKNFNENKGERTSYDKNGENNYQKNKKESGVQDKSLRTAAVMFVENTKEGKLAKNLREVVERVKHILGYSIKIVERAGTPLKLLFSLSRVGGGQECGRTECPTCTQESRGEKLPLCTKRSVLYENICVLCNPGVAENKKLNPPDNPPSIYVGETSKSLFERGSEHWRDFRLRKEDSHILKHHQIHHGGRGAPSFHLRPVRFFKTPLTRQIAEAVLIQRWGEDRVLNSKAEFNRSKISRLTLGEEEEDKWNMVEETTTEDVCTEDWERSKANSRRAEELVRNIDVGRGVTTSPANKRMSKEGTQESTKAKRTRKLQYPVLSETLGEEEKVTETITTIPVSEPSQRPHPSPSRPSTPLPPTTQSTSLGTTQYTPTQPSPKPDHNLLSQGRSAQGFPPVQVDSSEGHLHAGDLGGVLLRGGTVTPPPPSPPTLGSDCTLNR